MFEWIRKDQARRRDLKEIAALDDNDLTDIGLSREDLTHLAMTDPAVFARMDRMAALHGLTPDDVQADRPEFATLARTCEDCAAKGRCDDTLARHTIRLGDTGFCPNHDAYRDMAAK